MALGTVTVVEKGVLGPGGLRFVILNVQPSSGANYTANGETFDVSSYNPKISTVVFASFAPKDEASGATDLVYDYANGKLVAFDAATGVEEAGNQDLSGATYRAFILGT